MKTVCIAIINFSISLFCFNGTAAQLKWKNVDSLFQPLPASVHLYFTDQPIDTGVFMAYYLIADLKDKNLEFTADTTWNRRLTPSQFYEKAHHPLAVVNCTFFSFTLNRNVTTLIKDGKLISFDTSFVKGKGKDSLLHFFALRSVLGIDKKRKADVVWVAADSSMKFPVAFQFPKKPFPLEPGFKKRTGWLNDGEIRRYLYSDNPEKPIEKWKMQTAVGGGPALLQNGEIKITNNEEMMFAGKAIYDKHPRTVMGYTKDDKLIILMIQGRSESSGGATLLQEAQIMKDLGCWEALNLDGGGSSCLLVNGKETIKPSDKEGQRPVPAVFIIRNKK
jgi:exopolysaccharide biosynthesis protein